MKPLYSTQATVRGGRNGGRGRTTDGRLDVQLALPAEMGGDGDGTNPEQLFGVGYAACFFESALALVATTAPGSSCATPDRRPRRPAARRDDEYRLHIALHVSLPQITDDEAAARRLVREAHADLPVLPGAAPATSPWKSPPHGAPL